MGGTKNIKKIHRNKQVTGKQKGPTHFNVYYPFSIRRQQCIFTLLGRSKQGTGSLWVWSTGGLCPSTPHTCIDRPATTDTPSFHVKERERATPLLGVKSQSVNRGERGRTLPHLWLRHAATWSMKILVNFSCATLLGRRRAGTKSARCLGGLPFPMAMPQSVTLIHSSFTITGTGNSWNEALGH